MTPWGWWVHRVPEHAVSSETWNGGSGVISFNHVQQSEPDVDHGVEPDVTTDVWGISEGAITRPGS